MKLAGQRIVILGGSSGIGLATAQAAAREGAAVVIASSRKRRVEEALVALPAGAEGHPLDLTDEQAVKAFFAELGSVRPSGFYRRRNLSPGRLAETDIAAARGFFGLRYWGAFMAAKYASGHIRPGGSIVFTSGLAGLRPHAGWSLGASICAAMEGLTRALAVELAPIRVNIVSPGVVQNSALGKYDGSRSRRALSSNRGEASRRSYRRGRGNSRSLSLFDAADLRHRRGVRSRWRRCACVTIGVIAPLSADKPTGVGTNIYEHTV